MKTETFQQDGKTMERVIMDGGLNVIVRAAAKPAGEPLSRPKKMAEDKPVRREPEPRQSKETT